MTFLDSSVIIDMLAGEADTVAFLADKPTPYRTSSLCVFEVIHGKLGSGSTDVRAVRQDFDGVHSLALTEEIALEAATLQDELIDDGHRMATRDLLIAATAKSAGDQLIVADSDFETPVLEDYLDVVNLRANQ